MANVGLLANHGVVDVGVADGLGHGTGIALVVNGSPVLVVQRDADMVGVNDALDGFRDRLQQPAIVEM